jgi:hypothetical protein
MTTELIVGLIRRSNKTFWLSRGSDGAYSIKIDGKKYKITEKQYNEILAWSLSSATM